MANVEEIFQQFKGKVRSLRQCSHQSSKRFIAEAIETLFLSLDRSGLYRSDQI